MELSFELRFTSVLRDQHWSRGIVHCAHHLPSMMVPMKPRPPAWSVADETRVVFPWLALQWTIYIQAAMDAATYRLRAEEEARELALEGKHSDAAYDEKMYQAALQTVNSRNTNQGFGVLV